MNTPRLAYWSSGSNNTARFVEKLGLPAVRLPNSGDVPVMTDRFILITPTFADQHGRGAVPKPVIRFLNEIRNRDLLCGVVGSGNRNFGPTFGAGGREVARKCNVPVLHLFELAGDQTDLDKVTSLVQGITTLSNHYTVAA